MHYGSSEEETSSEEEARGPEDRRGEENDGEKDGHRPSQDRREEEIALQGRGAQSPRLPYSPSKTIG